MKLTIERAVLLTALSHVQSVVERRNTIPILSNVLLEADGEHLALTATDLDIAVVEKLPAKVDIREYPGYNEAYADLAAGRVVAVANSLPNIAFVASQRADTFEVVKPPFGDKSYFGYIGRKDADYASLNDAFDKALLKLKADGRLAAIQKKWFGDSFDTPDAVTNPAF